MPEQPDLTVKQFADSIRAKYPDSKLYKEKSDVDLANAFIDSKAEYRVYRSRIKDWPNTNNGAVASAMQEEGNKDYKPGQGLPFGHTGQGMRTGDVTSTQKTLGVLGIGSSASAVATAAAAPIAIQGAKAVGTWASKNPLQAFLLYQALSKVIPGIGKLIKAGKIATEGK